MYKSKLNIPCGSCKCNMIHINKRRCNDCRNSNQDTHIVKDCIRCGMSIYAYEGYTDKCNICIHYPSMLKPKKNNIFKKTYKMIFNK